ncbi:PglZ domain-containing protein [Sporomusa acidovorans]|uniref:PglZ domain protein n=1 Tax=Sporomusa acidovorans (strain ATCC 49682 / DSM 3132 / Mol) TaxID=1123286 RepID=A0ABZ3IZ47_SPOA4|nr:PglZ domain-containing protein [Sporomusa acidovorans]OZC14157.1 PglZ domain protein [Sporomusa acidovorans DSM 3132]SDE69912.1 PglZ domain-containing protein [Sporomusa acidovorans]
MIVIISDAFRYETGRYLYQKLQEDAQCTATLDAMMGVLPSYTRLGMAALLPHMTLEITDDFKVLKDGAVQKITNLIASLDFIQSEPVSDVVKATSYKLFFISEDNEKISSECMYVADKKDVDPQKRIFRLRFTFKNRQYDKSKKYYLVAYDMKNDLEVLRYDVVMDIAFANDFGFNV